MLAKAISQRSWLKWVLIGAGWTLFAFFFVSEVVVSRAYAGRPLNFGRALSVWLICASLWLAATPLVLWIARRFPLERHHWVRNVLVHLGVGAVISFLLLGLYVLIALWLGLEAGRQNFLQAFRSQLVMSFHSEVLTYWMLKASATALTTIVSTVNASCALFNSRPGWPTLNWMP